MGLNVHSHRKVKSSDSEESELVHAARITSDQVGAIATWLDYEKVIAETRDYLYRLGQRPCVKPDRTRLRSWLVNAWSTEFLVNSLDDDFGNETLAYAVHWLFPQLYYSIYAHRTALSIVNGGKEATHQAALNAFGSDAMHDRLPKAFCVCVIGTKDKPEAIGVVCDKTFETQKRLRRDDQDSVVSYIVTALRTTRNIDLDRLRKDRAGDFLTAKKQQKKNLSSDDWKIISKKAAPTSILSYLYRKRVKANYHNVDVFHSDAIDASQMFRDVKTICTSFALCNEAIICRKIGYKVFSELVATAPPKLSGFIKRRLIDVSACIDQ